MRIDRVLPIVVFLAAQIAAAKPLTVIITKVQCVDACDATGLEAFGESKPDFYAKITINGNTLVTPRAPDDQDYVEPFWNHSVNIPDGQLNAPVSIQIWDYDISSGDDLADISPLGGDNNLDFNVDMTNGRWSGDVSFPQSCVQGGGGDEPSVRICFVISTLSTSGDADGDGLLDSWETGGLDFDGDGVIDVDLPAMGADPNHKDLFLELDYVAGQSPNRAAIQAMKLAFANAPVNAGGNPNPDGKPGINIHVDTGTLFDPTASEGPGQPANSCNDGLDNNGDGKIDAADPACLVGDSLINGTLGLGGGNAVPGYNTCGLDSGFYNTKGANFNQNRKWVFRYAVSAQLGASCKPNGGQGEIGGNDFTEFNHDGGTVMHELGHTLNLHHGGNEDHNCKPNYVSVMNYDNQFGINVVGGGIILDYSPPRFSNTAPGSAPPRGNAPLGQLDENSLVESTILDPSDNVNRFVFVDINGAKVQAALNQQINWDSAINLPNPAPPQTFNIDIQGLNGGPKACASNTALSQMNGFNDWNVISVPFRQFGDSSSGAINATQDPEITLDELQALKTALNTTDLAVTKTDNPDPVAAGTNLAYTIKVTDNGPNPASKPHVVDTLPAGVAHVSNSANCAAAANILTCDLMELQSNAAQNITATVLVAHDLVYNAGAPVNLENNVVVSNLVGPDSSAGNDSASQSTKVIAVGDLKIVNFAAYNPPSEIIVGQAANLTMRKTITNLGPSWPMDAKLTRTATAPPDAVITPTSSTANELALALNEQRVVDEAFSVTCNGYSHHLFSFTNEIQPLRPDDTDPDQSNNKANATVDIECVVPVRINIKPGSYPNAYNMNGTVPVSVLTTSAGQYGLPLAFDATRIDPLSVRFGPPSVFSSGTGGTEIHNRGHIEDSIEPDDRTKDGDLDMVLHFDPAQSGLGPSNTTACVKGTWLDAQSKPHKFFGCDSIVLAPK
ncbi:MAG: DUF11 domain-containing protein [Acidobacteriia bacterium]|nr:DUF11 domain-containing protein [Terriglobia bacterium]